MMQVWRWLYAVFKFLFQAIIDFYKYTLVQESNFKNSLPLKCKANCFKIRVLTPNAMAIWIFILCVIFTITSVLWRKRWLSYHAWKIPGLFSVPLVGTT